MTTYATFDPANKSAGVTLSGGDLIATGSTGGMWHSVVCTSYKTSGKWYAEFTGGGSNGGTAYGISDGTVTTDNYSLGASAGAVYAYLAANGQKYNNTVNAAYGATFAPGAVISVLYDADAGSLSFWKNGSDQGVAYTGITGAMALAASVYDLTCTATLNAGSSAFTYTPPAGYYAWGDIPPEPGVGAGTLQELSAVGYRVAAGAGTMEVLTGSGGRLPYGVALLELLTASGAGGTRTGAGTMESMTASATGYQAGFGEVTTEALTASATGYGIAIAHGAITLSELTAAATGSAGSAGNAAVRFEYMTAEGHVAPSGAATLAKLTAAATGVTGVIGSGAVVMRPPTVAGTGTVPQIGTGAAVLKPLVASATGSTVGTGTAAVTLQAAQAAATGVTGTTGASELTLALMTAQATGYPIVTANGTIVMPPAYAEGTGHEAVTQTYKTWVMNSRNLDLTEYKNYVFNSYAAFNGEQYAAGSGGIYRLEGTDDAGADIDAKFMTGNLNGGTSQKSTKLLKIPEVLLTVDTGGPLTVTVEKEDMTRYSYNTPYVGINTMIQVRVEPGKGLRGLDYRVEVANNAGEAFNITELNVPLEETGRRLGDR